MTDALLAGDLPLPPRPNYLRDGDMVEVEIAGVGTLRNTTRREA